MFAKLARAGFVIAALGIAGCTESSVQDFAPQYANKQLPEKILTAMKAKGMNRNSPIMARIFKEEGVLEIWKQKTNGRYDVIATYPICKWSGKLGPKYTEGDRQAPEGFYTVKPSQMNPRSNYHLAFNVGFPNAYDRANGRTGANLMVHGACSSSGCYSMTDPQIEEIYAFGRDAFQGLNHFVSTVNARLADVVTPATVWTIGHVALHPNATSIVPGRADFTVQWRDADDARLDRMAEILHDTARETAERFGLEWRHSDTDAIRPTRCDPKLVEALAAAAQRQAPGSWRRMPSGALHDAANVSYRMPMAMLFVPSKGGISHNFAEDTERDDLVLGVEVLSEAVASLQ